MADVLIAGGGIAGSALATLLGRRGASVELFERDTFPREKPCGEGLMPAAMAVLERLRLAEAVGGAPFVGVRYHVSGRTVPGRFPEVPGCPRTGMGQRRRHLDRLLFETAARTPGVAARTGAHVEAPLLENGRVTGLVVDGGPHRGRLVVAADGAHSRLRRQVGLDRPARRKRVGVRAHFRLASGVEPPPWVEVFVGRGHELYVTPLPRGELLVAGLSHESALRGSAARAFERWWRGEPDLAARLDGAEQVSELRGAFPLSARSRAGLAPGVVLLGDAAGSLDPITGGGMAQALLTAELLADSISEGALDDDRRLASFDRARRRLLRDFQVLTTMVLWLSDHPHLAARSVGALRGCPAILSHLVGVSAGLRRLLV